jgi:hypothetical protein
VKCDSFYADESLDVIDNGIHRKKLVSQISAGMSGEGAEGCSARREGLTL